MTELGQNESAVLLGGRGELLQKVSTLLGVALLGDEHVSGSLQVPRIHGDVAREKNAISAVPEFFVQIDEALRRQAGLVEILRLVGTDQLGKCGLKFEGFTQFYQLFAQALSPKIYRATSYKNKP